MSGGGGDSLSVLDDRDAEPRTPMKRLGSTRKLAAFNNIRAQLTEQSRVLEQRAEAAAGVANELHDFCRRRADLEHEYARSLDKLARAAQQRHKDQKHKREMWSLNGAYNCWQTALENTRAISRDHSALADLMGGKLANRLQRAAEDALRIYRKCRDIMLERHEEVGGALAEAAASGKTHVVASTEWRAAATKLRYAFDQKQRLVGADPPRVKKLKTLDKELDKRRHRHSETRGRSLRARSDYLLCLEAANATLHRYYLDDVADLMLCMEVGFEDVVGRVMRTYAEAEASRAEAIYSAADTLMVCVNNLDAVSDRHRFTDAHAQLFTMPRRIAFQGIPPEQEDAEIEQTLGSAAGPESAEAVRVVAEEMAARLTQLENSARALRLECRENAKTLDAAETELIQQMEGTREFWEVKGLFGKGAAAAVAAAGPSNPGPSTSAEDSSSRDAASREQEDYYLSKFRSYSCTAGRLARIESKASTLRGRLLPTLSLDLVPPPPPPDHYSTHSPEQYGRRRRGRGQFAAPLDEGILTNPERKLPLVLTSCVRVIATYGIHHQGIFRVSGSQVEMQSLRAAFERGEDPLARVRDASDINSVCGLLKLYLRELRPPLLPPHLLDRLMRIVALQKEEDFVARMRDIIKNLPLVSVVVLRYLFAFLHHLTESADINMMDGWNLSICFGPTLLSACGEGSNSQVSTQNMVNELVKRIMENHFAIFPQTIAPHLLFDKSIYVNHPQVPEEPDPLIEGLEVGLPQASLDEPDANDSLSLFDEEEDEEDSGDDENVRENLEWREESPAFQTQPSTCDSPEGRTAPMPSTSQVRERERERANGRARSRGGSDRERERDDASAAPPPPERTAASSSTSTKPTPLNAVNHSRLDATPDLVLDLPAGAAALATPPSQAPPASASPAFSPANPATPGEGEPAGTADTFVHNRDTLKKRPRHSKTSSDDTSEACLEDVDKANESPAEASGSPVPARNTARVAAKFAELTLTGGSLKPALAAKPALLRRPTPHPVHANSTKNPEYPPG